MFRKSAAISRLWNQTVIRSLFAGVVTLLLIAVVHSTAFASGTGTVTNENVPSRDIREESARDYIDGILGGDLSKLLSSKRVVDMEKYGFDVWLRRAAYPATTWSWAQSVVGSISSRGNEVTVTVTKPSIYGEMDVKRARCIEEWRFYLRMKTEKGFVDRLDRKTTTRKFAIDGSGVVRGDFTSSFAKVESDFLRGLEVITQTKDTRFAGYIGELYEEIRESSTIRAPKHVLDAMKKTLSALGEMVK